MKISRATATVCFTIRKNNKAASYCDAVEDKTKGMIYMAEITLTNDNFKSEVLESYRKSFPCLVQPGYTVFNVIRTEVVPDKYSRWLIVGEFGDELWKTTIIRRDMQTYGEMLTLISKTETPDGITKLNEQNALPWE